MGRVCPACGRHAPAISPSHESDLAGIRSVLYSPRSMSTLPIALPGNQEHAEPPPTRLAPHRGHVIAALFVALATAAGTAWPRLNNDVTYAFGGITNAGKGGVSVWDVF